MGLLEGEGSFGCDGVAYGGGGGYFCTESAFLDEPRSDAGQRVRFRTALPGAPLFTLTRLRLLVCRGSRKVIRPGDGERDYSCADATGE